MRKNKNLPGLTVDEVEVTIGVIDDIEGRTLEKIEDGIVVLVVVAEVMTEEVKDIELVVEIEMTEDVRDHALDHQVAHLGMTVRKLKNT